MSTIPRRARLDMMTEGEHALRSALHKIESSGADPRLTRAQALVAEALMIFSDFEDERLDKECGGSKTTPADFRELLLKVWNAGCDLEYQGKTPRDFHLFSGATKDLLLTMGLEWSPEKNDYHFPPR